jgi:hypothetical protein
MPPINRGGFAALLAPDLRKVYYETVKERPLEYPMVLNVDDMDWNPMTDRQVAGLGVMGAKNEGSSFDLDEPVLGGTKAYEATSFGKAYECTFEAWRDELYGVFRELSADLARVGRHRQELSAWDAFNNAFSTTFTGFTAAESLCSTAHTGLDGTSRANRPSPDIGFSQTGIQNAIIRFEGMTDERGLPRLMTPTMALVTPTNKFIAREILGSAGKPYTADNEVNALIEEDLRWMVCHYITTATYWFLVTSKGIHDVNFLWRDHPIFDMFDDPWSKNAVATAYQRHTTSTFGSWRGIDGSTG